LPEARHRCKPEVFALAQSCGDGQWTPLASDTRRVLSELNEDLIF